jgi:hypothetical protein
MRMIDLDITTKLAIGVYARPKLFIISIYTSTLEHVAQTPRPLNVLRAVIRGCYTGTPLAPVLFNMEI